MPHDDPLRFPVASFHRVFDTTPVQEVLSLDELLALLRGFQLRADTAAAVDRELSRIDRALAQVLASGSADGPVGVALGKTVATARAAGDDPTTALHDTAARLATDARKSAKRDLRTWSPTLYTPGAERGSEGVLALSCLVFDYDVGATLEDAAYTWEPWFHLVHSTWSHRTAQPRFRVVIPLARPVAVEDWAAVWQWGADLTGNVVDRALKGTAVMFALPAVPSAEAERVCEVHPGALLDPADEGLVLRPAPELPPLRREPGSATQRDGRHVWVE